jgi:hypothetical protein
LLLAIVMGYGAQGGEKQQDMLCTRAEWSFIGHGRGRVMAIYGTGDGSATSQTVRDCACVASELDLPKSRRIQEREMQSALNVSDAIRIRWS